MENERQDESIPHGDPFALFDTWFAEAQASEPNDANAMALATANASAAPSLRMVLLKGHGAQECTGGGFTFFTNLESRKGGDLKANPQAALLFHWKSLRRQVRIQGRVHPVSEQAADEYFASRHRESQLGSAASDQSRPLDSRATYVARVDALREQLDGAPVPRPPHWSGFTLVPDAIEFWIDRAHRLHERRRFVRSVTGAWDSEMLYP